MSDKVLTLYINLIIKKTLPFFKISFFLYETYYCGLAETLQSISAPKIAQYEDL